MRRKSSRRKTIVSASASAGAAVLALGALLSGCGGSDREGYVATGAADPTTSHGQSAPKGGVELIPLTPPTPPDGGSSPKGPPNTPSGRAPSPKSPPTNSPPRATPRTPAASPVPAPPAPARSRPEPRPTPSPTSTATPPGPAELTLGTPRREPDADRRWCEKVTVPFTNTGGRPVLTGTVAFGTHIIDALGIDWATVPSTEALPVPIEAGRTTEKTWTVCVDAWRVPLGMHVETRDVSTKWA
jgi:hypothetical protein